MQLLSNSNSLIRELSLWFQHNSTKELHNRNRIECTGLKPGLHFVVTIAEDASYDAPKRILRLSTHRLQIFLVKYEYLQSLQLCEAQSILEQLINVFVAICLSSLRLKWRPGMYMHVRL